MCREINHSLASKPWGLWLMIKIIIFTTGSYIEDIACQNENQYKFYFFVLKTILHLYKRVHLDNKIQYSSHCVSFFLQTDCLQKQLWKSGKWCHPCLHLWRYGKCTILVVDVSGLRSPKVPSHKLLGAQHLLSLYKKSEFFQSPSVTCGTNTFLEHSPDQVWRVYDGWFMTLNPTKFILSFNMAISKSSRNSSPCDRCVTFS